jgi:hypothetical protein
MPQTDTPDRQPGQPLLYGDITRRIIAAARLFCRGVDHGGIEGDHPAGGRASCAGDELPGGVQHGGWAAAQLWRAEPGTETRAQQ